MTMTVSAQPQTTAADDLQIVQSLPTIADARLILQMQQTDALSGANEGWHALEAIEPPPTLAQLKKRHPRGSHEWQRINAFLASCETMATFVKHGLLNEGLVNDLFWIQGAWQISEKLCKGLRKEAGEPKLFENFEWLAKRAT